MSGITGAPLVLLFAARILHNLCKKIYFEFMTPKNLPVLYRESLRLLGRVLKFSAEFVLCQSKFEKLLDNF